MTDPRPAPKPRARSRPQASTRKPAGPSSPDPVAEPPPDHGDLATTDPAPRPAPAPTPGSTSIRRRIVVTGGAGFVGSSVCRILHSRGDQVVALVRDPGRAGRLRELASEGLELVESDLADVGALTDQLRDADAVVHAAGSYRVGIVKAERGAMWDANVGATTAVLDAAEAARVPRTVYVSTVNVFGNTRGDVVDESYRRDLRDGFLSWYDETKYGAHEVAEQRIRGGAPIVVVLPSQVYGPGDHSAFGGQLRLAAEGRLRYTAVDDVGVGLVHVDDLAAGIVAALDRGRAGESYVLSGPRTRLREAVELAASTTGRRAPALRIPGGVLRALAPVGRLIGQPNLRETISASAGVTYWASAAKAEADLDWHPRDLETGFRDTFARP